MKKMIVGGIVILVIFLLSSFPKNGWGDSMVLTTNWISGTESLGSNLKFNYYCSVENLVDGVGEIYIPWNINSMADVFNVQVPFGATYIVALDLFTITGLEGFPGTSFSFFLEVPKDKYEAMGEIVTSSGWALLGPDWVPDLGVEDQDSVWGPKYTGGPSPVIPEPASLILLGAGLFGLVGGRLSKKPLIKERFKKR